MTTKPEAPGWCKCADIPCYCERPKPEATGLSEEKAHESAPAALGWNVLQFSPPGPVQLTTRQRDDVVRELNASKQRIADLKMALGDGAGWFDRAMAAAKERDRLRAENASLRSEAKQQAETIAKLSALRGRFAMLANELEEEDR